MKVLEDVALLGDPPSHSVRRGISANIELVPVTVEFSDLYMNGDASTSSLNNDESHVRACRICVTQIRSELLAELVPECIAPYSC